MKDVLTAQPQVPWSKHAASHVEAGHREGIGAERVGKENCEVQ